MEAKLLSLLLVAFGTAPAVADEPQAATRTLHVLSQTTPCEASAILSVRPGGALLAIGDNEVDEKLFTFEWGEVGLEPKGELPIPKERPKDVEALARLGDDLVVVGSHSRKKSCEAQEKRLRLRRLRVLADGTLEAVGKTLDASQTWTTALAGDGAQCVATLFEGSPDGAAAVCKAFVEAEEAAERILAAAPPPDGREKQCESLNIEGAFGDDDGEHLWLGLRAPLVDGRAVVLRLVKGGAKFQLDRVAFLDLPAPHPCAKPFGIRELAVDGDWVYGIAGPTIDLDVPFTLFRVERSLLTAGGTPPVEIVRTDLEPRSEGLLIQGHRALVVIDGDKPKDGETACVDPARWYELTLP